MRHRQGILTDAQWADVRTVWDFHRLGHTPVPASAAVVLGGIDPGVATWAAALFHEGWFPWLVFTGATSPATAERFPEGEAVAYREQALSCGVPDDAMFVEPHATHTGQNITYSRDLLHWNGIDVGELMIVCTPPMERRAHATCRKQWPEVSVTCTSDPISAEGSVASLGDSRMVVDEIVGDLQRLWLYAEKGFAIEQSVPAAVVEAYHRLVGAGFDSRVVRAQTAL